MEYIEYFGREDCLCGWGLAKIETMCIPSYNDVDINDAIEYYQIHRYFKDGVRLKTWTDNQYTLYSEKSKKLYGMSNRFFNSLNNENIENEFGKVEFNYINAFWEMFNSVKLYKKISESTFDRMIHSERIGIHKILEMEKIPKRYGNSLRQYLLEHKQCIGILIQVYEQDYTDDKKLFLPSELTGQDISTFIEEYINSDNVNPNYLNAIFLMQSTDRFPISDEIRLMAKIRYEIEIKKISETGASLLSTISVAISETQQDEFIDSSKGTNIDLSYSNKWLLETLDYPSIMNNFIYIFEFVDFRQMRCNHVCFESLSGIIERTMRKKSHRNYPDYYAFKQINGLAMIQMQSYYDFLLRNKIRYEDVLQWVFTEYLQKEFDCSEMRLSMPSEHSTYLEKCQNICAAMEMLIKQFSQYVEKKNIDFELLAISSGSPKYGQIPSLVEKKYIYGKGKGFNYIKHLLFSDQCLLHYVKRIHDNKKSYRCFYDLLNNEIVYKTDYNERFYGDLDFLIKHDLITISNDGIITIGNMYKVLIVKDLYYNEVISRWHYPESFQPFFEEWIECDLLCEKSTLLTEPESKYFNYILNHSEFCNGLDLRNRYSHGNGQIISDEKEHIQNYNVLLRLMTILAIKINDDFCLFDEINNKTK